MIAQAAIVFLAAAAPPAYEREFSGGPAALTIRVEPTEVALSGAITVEQILALEDGFEGELPEFIAEEFEGFAIVERKDDPPASEDAKDAEGGRTILRRHILLEAERSGDRTIPSFTAYFHKAGEARENPIESEPVGIRVAPIAGPDAIGLAPMRGTYAPAAPAEEPFDWKWVVLGGIAAAGAALVAARVIRRRSPRLARGIPAHERAFAALRRLVDAKLVEAGEIEAFFVALSTILRTYIEDRFSVRAPERTTEEFLEEAARHEALAAHRDRLGDFLAVSDLVKFARYEPEDAQIERAFETAKRFILETAERAVPQTQSA
ncbi:MAG: hypothetical protein JXP34_08690 [Planctomycetes bacterium]|nr:hypothetical protein [Planctomycetota bacterium]